MQTQTQNRSLKEAGMLRLLFHVVVRVTRTNISLKSLVSHSLSLPVVHYKAERRQLSDKSTVTEAKSLTLARRNFVLFCKSDTVTWTSCCSVVSERDQGRDRPLGGALALNPHAARSSRKLCVQGRGMKRQVPADGRTQWVWLAWSWPPARRLWRPLWGPRRPPRVSIGCGILRCLGTKVAAT